MKFYNHRAEKRHRSVQFASALRYQTDWPQQIEKSFYRLLAVSYHILSFRVGGSQWLARVLPDGQRVLSQTHRWWWTAGKRTADRPRELFLLPVFIATLSDKSVCAAPVDAFFRCVTQLSVTPGIVGLIRLLCHLPFAIMLFRFCTNSVVLHGSRAGIEMEILLPQPPEC